MASFGKTGSKTSELVRREVMTRVELFFPKHRRPLTRETCASGSPCRLGRLSKPTEIQALRSSCGETDAVTEDEERKLDLPNALV
jgi:hypothetical protein